MQCKMILVWILGSQIYNSDLLKWFCEIYIYIYSYCTVVVDESEARWSPDIFQASSFQLLKLENLLRWSFFTFKWFLMPRLLGQNFAIICGPLPYNTGHFLCQFGQIIWKITDLKQCCWLIPLQSWHLWSRSSYYYWLT